ncbi:hypothetical protein [Massilia haematophila]|uniref:KfrA N-terminal DNA-binding domain-containing protein n=1 Tax=Massilia haematophila TaxID=457923 RepID=A0ABV7PED9_9BURK
MPKKIPEAPITGIEKELMDALARLKSGQPKNAILSKKAKLGKLRINAATVAREANRSRTLIGHDGCAYPRVRAAVKAAAEPEVPPTSFEDVNRRLREDNQELRKTVKLAMSQVAAMIKRMDHLEREATRRIKTAERAVAGSTGATGHNSIAGANLLRNHLAPVVPLPRRSDPSGAAEER